jgi:hypothetical protein
MTLLDLDHPDDERIVLAEVVVHLREIDHRRIADQAGLAEAWLQVHRCDGAVLDALDPLNRQHYQCIVDGPRTGRSTSRPARAWLAASTLRTGVAHLNVAVHRRLMLLQAVLNETAPGVADGLC